MTCIDDECSRCCGNIFHGNDEDNYGIDGNFRDKEDKMGGVPLTAKLHLE